MKSATIDRDTFLKNLRKSQLLTDQQIRLVIDRLGKVQDAREIAKTLAAAKLLTRFQARMLLVIGAPASVRSDESTWSRIAS